MQCIMCGKEIPEGFEVCSDCVKAVDCELDTKAYSVQSLVYPSMNSNPDGISADLFFKGCSIHCKGCHNIELQRFSKPNTSLQDIITAIEKHGVKILTLMGGEPLDVHVVLLIKLMSVLKSKFPDLKIALYTGHSLEEICPAIFSYIDYLKVGRYDCECLNPQGSFLASSNQHFYKILQKIDDTVTYVEYDSNGYYVDTNSILYL